MDDSSYHEIRGRFKNLCQNDHGSIPQFLANNKKHIYQLLLTYLENIYDKKIVQIFLEQDIDFTQHNFHGTFLHLLCVKPDADLIRAFIGKKININAKCWFGYTCLPLLCKNAKNANLVKYVLEQKYNLNLKEACLHQTTNHDIIKVLFEYKFNPNSHDQYGRTALQVKNKFNSETIMLYMKHGYDINCGPHNSNLVKKFVWTFRMRRNFNYDLKWYREYVAGKLDFRNPRLHTNLKRIARELLCVFKRLRVTRHIAYICLHYLFNNL